MKTEPVCNSVPESALRPCTAFEGHRRIASGPLKTVARKVKSAADKGGSEPLLVFDDATGEVVDLDLRGRVEDVIRRLGQGEGEIIKAADSVQKRRPGRPKLGVIAREVTLLPGQWDWLDDQPGGASAALRRLIYDARRSSRGKESARRSQDAVYSFMTTMAGNFPGFEEALRAFYRREQGGFERLIQSWPADIRDHLNKLVAAANEKMTPGKPLGI